MHTRLEKKSTHHQDTYNQNRQDENSAMAVINSFNFSSPEFCIFKGPLHISVAETATNKAPKHSRQSVRIAS